MKNAKKVALQVSGFQNGLKSAMEKKATGIMDTIKGYAKDPKVLGGLGVGTLTGIGAKSLYDYLSDSGETADSTPYEAEMQQGGQGAYLSPEEEQYLYMLYQQDPSLFYG